MADLKTALFNYLAHKHFDLMQPDVHDRFEEYDKNGSLTSNMKEWKTMFEGKPLVGLTTSITDPDDWKKFYHALQQTFQEMDANKKHPYAYGSDYNGATKDFIEKYFGDNSKTFTASKATPDVDKLLKNLGAFLEAHKADLKPRFTTNLSYVFNSDMSYEKFYDILKKGKFNDTSKYRDQIETVIQYITTFGPRPGYPMEPDDDKWPSSLGYTMTGPGATVNLTDVTLQGLHNGAAAPNPNLDKDNPNTWYEIPDEALHITLLQTDYAEIFDTILTDATVRKHFLAVAKEPVKSVLETAIAKTDYENKESDDYLPPMPFEKKNLRQRIEKWRNDTYENHLRRFTNPSRGTRLFFSEQSQNIMKGFDKAGIKPTDGLDGILSKKDDAKLKSVIDKDPTTRKHFEWFIKMMTTIKELLPGKYESALRNGADLREVVMLLISMTKKEDFSKAMTALEILSVAKYGLSSSRTLNNLREATKDMSILSDKNLSWNKNNEGIQFVTKAMDKTAGLAIRGLGLAATGIHNFIQHRRTKIGNNISNHKNLNDAYKKWQKEDATRLANLRTSNATHNVTANLVSLAAGLGASGRVIANEADLEAAQTDWALMGPGTVRDNLEKDIKLYKEMSARQKQEDDWREKNPDYMSKLAAHWNMLETVSITHAFTLGSMKLKRDAMFKDETRTINGKTVTQSHAKHIADAYYAKFGSLRTA